MTDASRPDGAPQDVEGASRSAGASTGDSINQAADPSTDSPSIQLLPDLDPASIPIRIHDMTIAYHRKPVLWDVDLDVPEGQLVGIVGPNGAGKSTMILAIMNLVPKASGWVRIYGKPYEEMRRIVGYVPQRESVDWDFPISALEVVTMGRFGHVGWIRRPSKQDKQLAHEALEKVGMGEYAHRQISQLSGGQQQRVFLARALAQDAKVYLMDEPFAGVDAATERAIIDILMELRAQGKTILVVHHDLQTVTRYFDWLIMLNMRVVASGPTEEVFNDTTLNKTYGGRLTVLSQAAQAVQDYERGRG
ncbi:MAG: manganese ABC transporter ATP-binding protein [Gemmatimonadetes bacterium]|nr:manganese ABC transporter ATP-binding protein [Gemmatimonadota bacterium]